MEKKFKMVVFDVDGTLVPGESIWETLHKAFGTTEHQKRHLELFQNGELKIHEWARRDISLWAEKGITRDMIADVIGKRSPIKNLKETLEELKKRGFVLAVVSGSIDIYFDTILKDVRDYFDYMFINRLIFEGNKLVGVDATVFDFEGKLDAVKKICEERGINLEDVIFVGDGRNDIHVMKACGLGIAINPKEDLGDGPDVIINTDDMRNILKFIL